MCTSVSTLAIFETSLDCFCLLNRSSANKETSAPSSEHANLAAANAAGSWTLLTSLLAHDLLQLACDVALCPLTDGQAIDEVDK